MKSDRGRALYWLQHGAQPTDTVRSLLRKQGILKEYRNPAKESAVQEA